MCSPHIGYGCHREDRTNLTSILSFLKNTPKHILPIVFLGDIPLTERITEKPLYLPVTG